MLGDEWTRNGNTHWIVSPRGELVFQTLQLCLHINIGRAGGVCLELGMVGELIAVALIERASSCVWNHHVTGGRLILNATTDISTVCPVHYTYLRSLSARSSPDIFSRSFFYS